MKNDRSTRYFSLGLALPGLLAAALAGGCRSDEHARTPPPPPPGEPAGTPPASEPPPPAPEETAPRAERPIEREEDVNVSFLRAIPSSKQLALDLAGATGSLLGKGSDVRAATAESFEDVNNAIEIVHEAIDALVQPGSKSAPIDQNCRRWTLDDGRASWQLRSCLKDVIRSEYTYTLEARPLGGDVASFKVIAAGEGWFDREAGAGLVPPHPPEAHQIPGSAPGFKELDTSGGTLPQMGAKPIAPPAPAIPPSTATAKSGEGETAPPGASPKIERSTDERPAIDMGRSMICGRIGYDLDNLRAVLGSGPIGKISVGYRILSNARLLNLALAAFASEAKERTITGKYEFKSIPEVGGVAQVLSYSDLLTRNNKGAILRGADKDIELTGISVAWDKDGRARAMAETCTNPFRKKAKSICAHIHQCWSDDGDIKFENFSYRDVKDLGWSTTECPDVKFSLDAPPDPRGIPGKKESADEVPDKSVEIPDRIAVSSL